MPIFVMMNGASHHDMLLYIDMRYNRRANGMLN